MKVYEGRRKCSGITATTDRKPLNPRLELRNHSPTGFEWGFGGSGPAQLALAILAACLGDTVALEHCQSFRRTVIQSLPRRRWRLTEGEVRQAVRIAAVYA